MNRRSFLMISAALLAASCGPTVTAPQLGPDGKPLPRVYRIPAGSDAKIEYSMLDSVNALRQARGVAPLQLDARLNAAAATHARDMSVQNRPWHFGSDGSSPVDRVRRAGYSGELVGEAISETFETELEGLIKHFTPEFITYAASADWPATPAQFQAALKYEGPLAIDEDRRKAGLEFISLYCDIMHAMVSRNPAINDIRAFFEEIGFENVKLHDSKQIGRTKFILQRKQLLSQHLHRLLLQKQLDNLHHLRGVLHA